MSLSTDIAGPLDVRTEDLKQIDAGQAVDLFRQLLVIEAAKVGAPITAINVPADINTADGGIDADVATHFCKLRPGRPDRNNRFQYSAEIDQRWVSLDPWRCTGSTFGAHERLDVPAVGAQAPERN
ncbi:MAG: hypothetical protein EKK53_19045 [Burkholderiales bacterium]|nr:MAG: hypothetical protein EKK53_19045 [Burkholderiales bacterium]